MRIVKNGLATMTELQTILGFNDVLKMNAYLAMENAIDKALMPKVPK